MRKDRAPNRYLAYFQGAAGRKMAYFCAGATTIGLLVGNFVPHTFGLNYYKQFVQSYEAGVERPIPEKVLRRLDMAMEKLDLHPYERLLIKPFTVLAFDLFQAGSTKYRFGSILGVPVNYGYKDSDDINRSEIVFRNTPINWQTDSGKLLESSIVLTENEQIFGLCKSILQLQTHRVLMNSIFPSVSFLMVYTLGRYLNIRLNLFQMPLSFRLVMYSILGLFGLGSWTFMKDFNQVSYDADIDKKLSTLGPEYIAAGVSYYDKILKKNMALRELIGDDTYTAKGNLNYFLRQKSLPLTLRKSFFEEKWKELSKNSSSNEIPQ